MTTTSTVYHVELQHKSQFHNYTTADRILHVEEKWSEFRGVWYLSLWYVSDE